MPSTTRGSILISTANDIGEALVEKLGGVGYSPNEWKEKYNLCGIAPVDSAPALSVLADSAGTGDERGSILIATADAIGAILNKKYNVLRGFKPKEWASACRKMKALEEGSVASSSIASFSDGADDVPTKSLVVTIPPTLTGFSEVSVTQSERNFYPIQIGDDRFVNNGSATHSDDNGTLVIVSSTGSASGVYINTSDILCEVRNVLKWCYDRDISRTISFDVVASVDNVSLRVTSGSNTLFTVGTTPTRVSHVSTSNNFSLYTVNTPATLHIRNFQIELGSTAHDYEPYQTPTQYTASLGRTIYSGQVDIVNGTGTDENGNDFTFDGQEINTRLGYNAFWSDSGDTAVEYYKAPTPYARKTATGGIANFSDQRTDLPLTKAIANIAPSIAGKSAVNLYQGKKNLLNANDSSYTFQVGDNYRYNCGTVSLKKGVTYTFSALQEDALTSNTRNTLAIGVNEVYTYESATGTNYHNQSGVHSMQYTPAEDCEAVFLVWVHTPSNAVKYSSFMLEVGSSASAFEPYQAPTTYTAELGETVYGGSVDFVSGEVVKEQDITTLTNDGWTYYATGGKNTFNKIISGAEAGEIGLLDGYTFEQVSYISQQSDKCFFFYASGANVRISIRDDAYTSAEEFAEHMNGEKLVYTIATPTESAIPGRVISPIEGVNNYWNDAGGDTEIQYFENEA